MANEFRMIGKLCNISDPNPANEKPVGQALPGQLVEILPRPADWSEEDSRTWYFAKVYADDGIRFTEGLVAQEHTKPLEQQRVERDEPDQEPPETPPPAAGSEPPPGESAKEDVVKVEVPPDARNPIGILANEVVRKFAPNAHANYVKAFANGGPLLQGNGITTPRRLAHFMAQCLHETGGLTVLIEKGTYTEKSLAKMWDSGNWHRYFENRAACLGMADQCRIDRGVKLFNLVYSARMGNGPPSSGDGWKYRGRGILQTTGRESYQKFGKKCGVDFEGDPDLVFAPEHALKPALAEWREKNCNAAADRDDILAITKAINGGTVGLSERRELFAQVFPFIAAAKPG